MNDPSKNRKKADKERIARDAELAHRNFLFLFGQDQGPDQILSALQNAMNGDQTSSPPDDDHQ